jgi:hypothetical protein
MREFGRRAGIDVSGWVATPEDTATGLLAHVDALDAPVLDATSFWTLAEGGKAFPFWL